MTEIKGFQKGEKNTFNNDAYKARMAAYVKGINEYRHKSEAEAESRDKADRIGGKR